MVIFIRLKMYQLSLLHRRKVQILKKSIKVLHNTANRKFKSLMKSLKDVRFDSSLLQPAFHVWFELPPGPLY